MSDSHVRFAPALIETIAGLSAGTASTLVAHPLDVIKTRLQVQKDLPPTSAASLDVIRSLLQTRTPVVSFYRGLTPNLIGNASSWALFFYFKSTTEAQLRALHARRQPSNSSGGQHVSPIPLSPLDYFVSSAVSGIAITVITNPIWVIKTRMLSTVRGSQGAYTSMFEGISSIWKLEGFRGFYRGVGISMLGTSHGAVQFAVYDPLKQIWSRYFTSTTANEAKMSTTATLVLSAVAKIIAGTTTYPYQVVRSRLQAQDADVRFGRGIRGVVANVWHDEGLKGFYRGIAPNIFRVLPATWVTFLVYENVRWGLRVA